MPHQELLPGDLLRLGYEDEPWHTTERLKRAIPKGGKFYPKSFARKPHAASQSRRAAGTPVFLIDRREKALKEMLDKLEADLPVAVETFGGDSGFRARLPAKLRRREKITELNVFRRYSHANSSGQLGLWLSEDTLSQLPRKRIPSVWWWLPPVVWPDEADGVIALVGLACKKGAHAFVLNAPWQITFFKNRKQLKLWAGPFCNLTNALALDAAKSLGLAGVIVSPELGREDYLQLARQRPLALGIVLSGNWPLCVSRTKAQALKINEPFNSPRGETAWLTRHASDYWMYPNWKLDLLAHKEILRETGYSMFVHLNEPLPKKLKLKRRPGLWNWDLSLH